MSSYFWLAIAAPGVAASTAVWCRCSHTVPPAGYLQKKMFSGAVLWLTSHSLFSLNYNTHKETEAEVSTMFSFDFKIAENIKAVLVCEN